MPSKSLTIEQVLALLAATPPRLAALTDGLAPAQLQSPPNDNAWSANEVLAYLRACADVWGDCIVSMIVEDTPALRAINPRRWLEQTGYRDLEFQRSLRAFARQRADLLTVMRPLPPEGWARAATVIGAGKPHMRTVLSYGQRLAGHERQHVEQIAGIVTAMQTASRR